MNAVWNSYGQLCGCPEIFKKSCKFFCRELDIRVTKVMETDVGHIVVPQKLREIVCHPFRSQRRAVRFCDDKPIVIVGLSRKIGKLLLFLLKRELFLKIRKGHFRNRQGASLRFCRSHFGDDICLRGNLERQLLYN